MYENFIPFLFVGLCWVFVESSGFCSCGEQGLLLAAVRRPLTAVASRCGAPALGARASVVAASGLSSWGTWA